jgi:radical SAM-linked protein
MVNRVRIRFCKEGDLSLISHRDLVRLIERLFRRAEIAVRETEGFHPKPRMNFAAPLSLGIAGLDEVMEVDLAEATETDELLATLVQHATPGLTFMSVEPLPQFAKKAQASELRYEAQLTPDQASAVEPRVAELLAAHSFIVMRDDRPIDIRPLIVDLSLAGQRLAMRLSVIHEAGARPRDVLSALGLLADEIVELELARTQVKLHA